MFEDDGNGDLNIFVHADAAHGGLGSGKHDTITSIANNVTGDYCIEIAIEATGEPTPDHDTLLLVHSDTSDGSTSFTDSSPLGATITAHGNVQHDTAQTLGFGSSCVLFDGTGDYLSVPSNALYTLGTGSFTIEARVRWSASPATEGIITNRPDGSASGIWAMNTNASSKFVFGTNSATLITGGTTLAQDTNYHLAVVRAGNQLSLYVNGASDATVVANTTNFSTTAQLFAGTDKGGAANFTGWLKEIRVSKVARWDAPFTPPAAVYP